MHLKLLVARCCTKECKQEIKIQISDTRNQEKVIRLLKIFLSTIILYGTQHFEMNHYLSQKVKTDFLPCPKSVSSILLQIFFTSDIPLLRYDNFIDDVVDQWKVDFENKALKDWESEQSIGVNSNSKVYYFLHENTVSIKQLERVRIEDSPGRFQNMQNLKIDLGTIFWDILVCSSVLNSKSSLPTTGIFWFVESHSDIE